MQYDENAEKYGYEGEMTPLKCDELKPLVFSISDLAYIDESAVKKNFENPHDHAVYKATEVDAAIAELKTALNEAEEARYEAGADAADYYQDNCRLKRALWIMRAERASDKARIFYFANFDSRLDIDGYSYDPKKKKTCTKLAARIWRIIWLKVERKCRAKAEEYK